MVEDGNKPGCFDPEEFRAGRSSSGPSSAATGGAAGSPGTAAQPQRGGAERCRQGETAKPPPVIGMPFFLNGFGIEMQTTDLQKTAEQGSEHTHASRSCQGGEATVGAVGRLKPAPLPGPGRPAGCPGGGRAAGLSPPPLSAP